MKTYIHVIMRAFDGSIIEENDFEHYEDVIEFLEKNGKKMRDKENPAYLVVSDRD
jgi:hypothetical protein